MFFGNEKINRESCSEEKKVRGKTVYFYGLESGLSNARRKLFRGARRFIGRRERFWKIFVGFPEFFWNFSVISWKISTIFWKIFAIFWKISIIFCDFSENFSENSRSQSVTVQPGSRHYCKFTIKFTPKFTPILIKILQSTKFEGSHFHNLSQPFTTLCPLFQLLTNFHDLFASLCSFPFAAAFSQP